MQLVAQCVQSIDESQTKLKNSIQAEATTTTNWNDLIQQHKCFSRFVRPISFDEFVASYTVTGQSNLKQAHGENKNENDKTTFDILTHLSNAIASPDTMNLIVHKFLKNLNITNK